MMSAHPYILRLTVMLHNQTDLNYKIIVIFYIWSRICNIIPLNEVSSCRVGVMLVSGEFTVLPFRQPLVHRQHRQQKPLSQLQPPAQPRPFLLQQ